MNLGLRGKRALVTGGSHGIGLATACALADEGCRVAICARDEARLEQALTSIRVRGGEALGLAGDVLVPSDVSRIVDRVCSAWMGIDILVNNVGGGGRWGMPSVEDTPEEVWLDVYSKNAMAAVRFTRLVLPGMRQRKWGRIVSIASIYGREGGGRPWFNMAKSAEISLMKCLAMDSELARHGITFNTVAPGGIMIPGTGWDEERQKDPEAFDRMVRSKWPLGRMGTPEEVAYAVVMLCSKRASLISGACLVVDGGESHSF